MKLFDENRLAALRKKHKTELIIYICAMAVCVAACVLAAVFAKKIGRIPAQITATVLTAFCGCFSVYFLQVFSLKGKIIRLYAAALETRGERTEGILKEILPDTVTVNKLTFFAVDITTDKGERRLLIPSDKPLPQTEKGGKFRCTAVNNVITEYEEDL